MMVERRRWLDREAGTRLESLCKIYLKKKTQCRVIKRVQHKAESFANWDQAHMVMLDDCGIIEEGK